MLKSKSKIIIILGPTASGKSDIAIKLAHEFNGEIISADSRQVFRGMDIGSGKVPNDNMSNPDNKTGHAPYFSEGIIHHLIDVADPNDDFNISHFKDLAEKAIQKILNNGKVPIICGGTGFWIQSLTENLNLPKVKPDEKLRAELNKLSAEELFIQLENLDPERAENIDKQNKYRLIRAIEICRAIGKVPKKSINQSLKYDFLEVGINIPREELNIKIKKRLQLRLKLPMIEEVKNLHSSGVSWERLENFGLEYRWIARFLQDKIAFEEMKQLLYFDIIHYAKRQMTWFQKNKKILWLDDYSQINQAVESFLK